MEKEFDVFLSHAVEDKDLATPLAKALISNGISVWYSGFNLQPGDSITDKVNHGIYNSHYGIILLSPKYLTKKWARAEGNAFFAMETFEQKRIIPIWHHVVEQDIIKQYPILADRFAIPSSKGIETIASEIIRIIKPESSIRSSVAQNDLEAKLYIKSIIAKGKVKQAMEALGVYIYATHDCFNDLVMLKSRLAGIHQKENRGVLSADHIEIQKARIGYALIDLVDEVL